MFAALSREMRLLSQAWDRGDFPKHLEWIELYNIRGWSGQRVDFNFPITAIVGENGAGKSTLMQAAAAIYENSAEPDHHFFASDFFPDTPWESISSATIRALIKEGQNTHETSVRKPSTRWRGNEERKSRKIRYLDLKRILPITSRTGYGRLAKSNLGIGGNINFDEAKIERLSRIIGRDYNAAQQSYTSFDPARHVPVLEVGGVKYSGFHQGAGETTISELLAMNIPDYSLVLIDEIETSLHPRAQRRLMRDLAKIAREKKVQFIITTHSPYVLEEIPPHARIFVARSDSGKIAVAGVSSEFALSKMDEENHPEIDVYLEDVRAKIFLEEILAEHRKEVLPRISLGTFGSASVGKSLGMMVEQGRFRRPTLVYLDGDQMESVGCHILPGEDNPETCVFNALRDLRWPDIAVAINRSHSDFVEYAEDAMTQPDHHLWVKNIADRIYVGGDEIWRAMCRTWVKRVLSPELAMEIVNSVEECLNPDPGR
ncbi:AAA family ATPase [Vogesella sp. LIG4]|uniref:AAA family ATPase n=1 Tax=Vogesella sp. LIG4 TaxID=1192162 RepID=UPI00081FEC8A|nr:AAA family ATPase [Vogesella sp. LIG4]SCK25761.1 Predicted ATPase [Vogesella sp. LIG4]